MSARSAVAKRKVKKKVADKKASTPSKKAPPKKAAAIKSKPASTETVAVPITIVTKDNVEPYRAVFK